MAIFIVTSNSDVSDASDGVLTLREAIELANGSAGTDTIMFDAAVFDGGENSLVRLTQGELSSTGALIIDGSSATEVTITGDADGDDTLHAGTFLTDVKGSTADQLDDNSRVLAAADDTTLQGITITGGRTTGLNADGGGVRVSGDLVVRDSKIIGNSTTNTASEGGGVKATGFVHVVDSTVSDNHTSGSSARGGGIHALGDVVILRSTLADNSTTGQEGDGGAVRGDGAGGILVIDSTVSGNSTGARGSSGGGLQARRGDLVAVNTTVANNHAADASNSPGGGLHSNFNISVTNSTVTGNSSGTSGGGIQAEGIATVKNSIIAGNAAPIGDNVSLTGGPSIGTNSTTSNADVTAVFEETAPNAADADIQSGVLGNNGGPTQTVALKATASNPAVDTVSGTANIGATLSEADLDLDLNGDGDRTDIIDSIDDFQNDQRGAGTPREVSQGGLGGIDRGAVELSELEDPGLIVTTNLDVVDATDGLTSLREALAFADTVEGVDTITFDSSVFAGGAESLIRLTEGTLAATEEIIIDGSGAVDLVITGDAEGDDALLAGTDITDLQNTDAAALANNTHVFNFAGDATLTDLTVTGGRVSGFREDGGGIDAKGKLTLTNVEVSGNIATGDQSRGGGIHTEGTLTASNITVRGNAVTGEDSDGGGIFAEGAETTIEDSIISGNRAEGRFGVGGGFAGFGPDLEIRNSLIADNFATSSGGGVFGDIGTRIIDSTIINNVSESSGGGVRALNSSIENSVVANNTAATFGGGFSGGSGSFAMLNSTFSGNHVESGSTGGGGGFALGGISITDSIVLGNTTGDPSAPAELATSSRGEIEAFGTNIVGADTAAFDASTDPNIINADPVLVFAQTEERNGGLAGVLDDNDGFPTIALKADADNPALDAAGPDAPAQDGSGAQRVDLTGIGADGANFADLGARELGPVIPGTEGDDTLDGTEEADRIVGLGGTDILNGFDGDDVLEGGSDDDMLDGGAGEDVAVFNGAREDFSVVSLANGDVLISHEELTEGDDILRNIEFVQFSDTGPLPIADVLDDIGETEGTAGTISLGEAVTGEIETAADVDIFVMDFFPEPFVDYIIDVEGVDTNGGTLADPKVTFGLFTDGVPGFGDVDADSGFGRNSQLEFGFAADLDIAFFVAVEAQNGTDVGSYTVTVRELDDLGDDPNEDRSGTISPAPIEIGQDVAGDLQFSSDRDYFSVELEAGTAYLINLEGAATGAGTLVDPSLRVGTLNGSSFFSGGRTDDNGGTGQNAQMLFTPSETETFVFEVSEPGADEFGTYTLSVEAFQDDFIDAESFAGPPPVALGEGESISGEIETQGDRDVFRIRAEEGERYILRLDVDDPTPDGAAELQLSVTFNNQTGTFAPVSTDPIGDGGVSFVGVRTVFPTQAHSVQVKQAAGSDVLADYTLSFEAVDAVADGTGNLLLGTGEADSLDGLAGDDEILGLAGDDRIVGGTGDDILTGGADADVFLFGPADGADIITDFTVGEDTLDLSAVGGTFFDLEITDTADGALITYGDTPASGSVLLQGVSAAALEITDVTGLNNGAAFAETGVLALTNVAQTVTLAQSYESPVVVAFVATENGLDPVTVRISEIAGDQLTLQLQEPNHLDGRHTAETVTYLVVEAGTWMLPDGSLLEAGTVDSSRLSSQGFERVTFDAEFDDTPVVLSQVQTLNGGDFVTTRQRPADADGVELTMQEEEANNDGSHAVETLGWVAIEAGAGTSGGIGWLAGSAGGVTDGGATVALGDGVADDAHVLATLASFAGSDPAWARGDGNTGTGFDVSVEEDTSRDDETDHTAERIDYIAFDGAGTLYTAPLEQVAETGVLALTNVAQTVTLAQSYESPVVVAFVATENGLDPVTVRISEIAGDQLTLQLQEPNHLDGRHTAETVTYLVVEAGTWMLPDGSLLEAGTVDSSRLSSQGFERVTFDAEFDDTPVVLSQVQTLNGGDFVTTRQRPADADGVELTMQEEEANNDGSHAVETLGWVAIEAGAGTSGGIGWLAGSAGGVTDGGATVALGDGVADDAHVLATLASFAGSDPAWARGDGNTGTGFDVSVEEDTSRDDETDHTAERIDYIAFDETGIISAYDFHTIA
ncbi:MAG: hypothetical protein AAGK98_06985 [Pseudomonadota bacterium]